MEQTENSDPPSSLRLSDLRAWHIVTATCPRCHRQTDLTVSGLAWERPANTRLTDLARHLRCTHCGNREGNTFAVRAAPRN
jgi:hypothetical protein